MKIINEREFIKDLQKYAIDRFGFLTKNDYEVLLYHLLIKHSDLADKSYFEQSIELRMPESKIKRLAYEANLRHGIYNKNEILNDFFTVISKSHFVGDGKNIKFAIQDKYLRSSIQAEVYKMGSFMDGSFNSDVVSINGEAFVNLIKELFRGKGILHEIEHDCETAIRKDAEAVFSWKDLGIALAYGTAEEIPRFLSNVIAPSSTVSSIAKTIVSFIINHRS